MTRVRVLPEILANKIAAGEVVERPASVVKELVENALDAGARQIDLEIRKGGRELIRVVDDGHGMSRDDLLLAIERHATSKIKTDDDLFAIRTMGFRGEALPSIAAVSKLKMTTCRADDPAGTCLIIEGGRVQGVTEVGAPIGTLVEVAHLFFNVPARRKFLKTVATEMGHIVDVLARIALSNPHIHFRLQHNGRQVKQWTAVTDPALRVVDVLGSELEGNLIAIDARHEWVGLKGWVATPVIFRGTTRGIFLFVNNRFVRDRVIQHALLKGFEPRLVKGQYPVAILNVQVPFDKVDVNVHPAKHEVRFEKQQVVHQAIVRSLQSALTALDKAYLQPEPHAEPAAPQQVQEIPIPLPSSKPIRANSGYGTRGHSAPRYTGGYGAGPGRNDRNRPGRPSGGPTPQNPTIPSSQAALFETAQFAELRILGQLHGTYLVCESKAGLLLIDQHAAHERICFEHLKNSAHRQKTPSQKLLLPLTLELGSVEAETFQHLIAPLNAAGVEIEPFGGNSFVIKAVPVIMMGADMVWILRDLAETASEIGVPTQDADNLLDRYWIEIACHQSIRAHHDLTLQHARTLLDQLDRCRHPANCPHGRPVWIQWTHRDIEKTFHRTK